VKVPRVYVHIIELRARCFDVILICFAYDPLAPLLIDQVHCVNRGAVDARLLIQVPQESNLRRMSVLCKPRLGLCHTSQLLLPEHRH